MLTKFEGNFEFLFPALRVETDLHHFLQIPPHHGHHPGSRLLLSSVPAPSFPDHLGFRVGKDDVYFPVNQGEFRRKQSLTAMA